MMCLSFDTGVCKWDMGVGLAPLWSAWMECSNDVHFAVSWILTPNNEKPWIIAFGWVRFSAKMWPTLKSTFRTSFERFFHADCNGAIPSFMSHSRTKIRCVFHLTLHGGQMFWGTHILYISWNRNDTKLDHCDLHEWNIQMMSIFNFEPK